MKILFICKYNAFRSRVAEEYFKKINQNKEIKVISRGLIMDGKADEEQRKIAKELLDIDILGKEPEPLNLDDLINSDRIIIAADDVPAIMFNYSLVSLKRKISFWKIKDEQKKNKKNIRKTILLIKNKVDKLNRELEKK